MHHAFRFGDTEHNVAISRSATGYRLHLGEPALAIDLRTDAQGRSWLTLGEQVVEVIVALLGDDVFIHIEGEAYQLRHLHPLDRLASLGGVAADDSIRAPMPGNIIAIEVQEGASVSKGQALLVMESMKMETIIGAPRDGVVQAIAYGVGQTFDRDALLLSLEPIACQEPTA